MQLYEPELNSGILQVPVIAVFTKFDQFKREIKMKLEDDGRDPETDLDAEVEEAFQRHYLAGLAGSPPFIRLESEDFIHNRGVPSLFLSSRNAQARPTGC
jgi:hypothetical protein